MHNEISIELLQAYLDGAISAQDREQLEKVIDRPEGKQQWYDFLAEQYVAGELNAQWTNEASDLVDRDKVFAETVAFHQSSTRAIRSDGQAAIRKEVRQLLPPTDAQLGIRKSLLWLSVAAVILVVVGLSLGVFRQDVSGPELFAESYAPYEMLLSTRAGSGSEAISVAVNAYQQGDFATAYAEFALLFSEDDEPLTAIYAAISAIETGKEQEAERLLNRILEDHALNEHAMWYLSLLQLKNGQNNAAKELLKKLEGSSSYYQKAASKLQKRLD